MVKNRKEEVNMYAVKVLHGYITNEGRRTRDKESAKFFENEKLAAQFADKIGGRVKKIDDIQTKKQYVR
jgi:nitrous oxide reductase accessory protein NosL